MIQDLLAIATQSFELLGNLQQAKQETRQRAAEIFARIGTALETAARTLKQGEYPHSALAELRELTTNLADIIDQEGYNPRAQDLSQQLRAFILQDIAATPDTIQAIQTYAGRFKAIALQLRAGRPKPSPQRRIRGLGLACGAVALGGLWLMSQPAKSSASPQFLLDEYVAGLSARDFDTVERIFPSLDPDQTQTWLEGGAQGKAPIQTIQRVGPVETTADAEQPDSKMTVRATLRYCRDDRTGSTDVKDYIFVKEGTQWYLHSQTAPEQVTPTRC